MGWLVSQRLQLAAPRMQEVGGGLQETGPEHPGSPTLSPQTHGLQQLSVTSPQEASSHLYFQSGAWKCSGLKRAGWKGVGGEAEAGTLEREVPTKFHCSGVAQENKREQMRLKQVPQPPLIPYQPLQHLGTAESSLLPSPSFLPQFMFFPSLLSETTFHILGPGLWVSGIHPKHPTTTQKHPKCRQPGAQPSMPSRPSSALASPRAHL